MAAWRLAVELDKAAAAEGKRSDLTGQLEKQLRWSPGTSRSMPDAK